MTLTKPLDFCFKLFIISLCLCLLCPMLSFAEEASITFAQFANTTLNEGETKLEGKIFGRNLDSTTIFPTLLKDGVEEDSNAVTLKLLVVKTKNATVELTFTPNTSAEDRVYKVYFGNKANHVSETFTQKGSNTVQPPTTTEAIPSTPIPTSAITPVPSVPSAKPTLMLQAATYKDDRKNLTLSFSESLNPTSLSKAKITLVARDTGAKTPLSAQDLAIANGNTINVLLENAISPLEVLFTDIALEEGTVQSVSGNPNIKVQMPLSKAQGENDVVESFSLSRAILPSEGGELSVVVVGKNLNERSATVKAIDADSKTPLDAVNNAVKAELKDGKLYLTLTFPPNTKPLAQSYTLAVRNKNNQKIDDGVVVATQLAKGQHEQDSIFATIDINSYAYNPSLASGTFNFKHTVTSKGQSSKKTWGVLYGANLNWRNIGVIITDQNGVTWPQTPSTVDGKAKYFRFLGGVPTNTVSIKGSGETVFYEILLPNDLDKDMTFTYQFTQNGTPIEGAKVTATVEKTSASPQSTTLHTLTLNFVNEQGETIAPNETMPYYAFLPLSIEPKALVDFTFRHAKGDAPALFGAGDRVVHLIYLNTSPKAMPSATVKPLIHAPQTGDTEPLIWWSALLALALGFGFIAAKKPHF